MKLFASINDSDTASIPRPPFSAQVSILNFEKVVRKKLVFGEDLDIDINIYCHRYLLAGHTMFFVKKRLSKTKCDFEGSVSQFLV